MALYRCIYIYFFFLISDLTCALGKDKFPVTNSESSCQLKLESLVYPTISSREMKSNARLTDPVIVMLATRPKFLIMPFE